MAKTRHKTGDERLLEAAFDAKPDSEFVSSVWNYFEEHGYITERQRAALERIVDDAGL